MLLSKLLGVPPAGVRVHATFLGGGFGRKASPDFLTYAALAARASGRPVKLLYSRTEDLRHDYYRPKAVARMRGYFDAFGTPLGLAVKLVAQSVSTELGPPFDSTGGVDFFTTEGLTNLRYDLPQLTVEYVPQAAGLRVGALRSIGAGANAFFVECFIDEMAQAAGKDPLQFRRELLADSPRYLALLDRVAAAAGWGRPLPEGRRHGLAVFEYHGTIVAEIAEVSVDGNGAPVVHKVTAAADCGRVLNPTGGRAQVEGSIVFALSDAMWGDVRVERGAVVQRNFDDYRCLRLPECPSTEVHFVDSGARITGLGEPAVPPLAPAVANALHALTGRRVRSLPFVAA
jgi:isoquinoline 1-oxidoreductase beta subunit